MTLSRRIFVSAPADEKLVNDRQRELKAALLRRIRREGFEPEEFFVSGIASGMSWSFRSVDEVMRRCHGAFIWAAPRWTCSDTGGVRGVLPTEYTHYEGAVANTHKLPILTIAEQGMTERGFIWNGGGNLILWSPPDPDKRWLADQSFKLRFELWAEQVRERRDIFLGYSSKSKVTANAIRDFLTDEMGASVLDWARDFYSGGTILEEIDRADRLCSGGIFLFSRDDLLSGRPGFAAPRDNVVFEAGYFIKSKGKERVLIIREADAKMPADVGGNIYLQLPERKKSTSVPKHLSMIKEHLKEPLRSFLANRL